MQSLTFFLRQWVMPRFRDFDYIRDRIKEGAGISAPLKSAKYFTPMVVDMIAIGEESGNIDEMLREVTKHYDDEVEYAVKGLSEHRPDSNCRFSRGCRLLCPGYIYADVGSNQNGNKTLKYKK